MADLAKMIKAHYEYKRLIKSGALVKEDLDAVSKQHVYNIMENARNVYRNSLKDPGIRQMTSDKAPNKTLNNLQSQLGRYFKNPQTVMENIKTSVQAEGKKKK